MQPILVTGGAGYIGSHAVKELVKSGRKVIVVDNLSAGHRGAIPENVDFEEADTRDFDKMKEILEKYHPSAVMHFAAFLAVGESVEKPIEYYDNNLVGVLRLLTAMRDTGVKQFIFSSTAAVYGQPENIPVTEKESLKPESPYGQTKLSVEQMLPWVERAYGIKYTVLRYFNAAGADDGAQIGLDNENATNLIPKAIYSLLKGGSIEVFGTDYPTPDGTGVRDYIHVSDLADAHLKALERLEKGGKSDIFNLGTGKGTSVKEIINAVEKASGKKLDVKISPRRAGDPAKVWADSSKAQSELGWSPKYTNIEEIVATSWKWHSTHPDGYKK
jgi:UDP-glucose 4-epimerase